VIEEQFSVGDSGIHGLDPRVKIIVAVLFPVTVALSGKIFVLLSSLALSMLLIAFSGLPIRKVLYRLLFVNGFVLFLWFFLPFTYGGEAWFAIGPLTASREGVSYAVRITIKCNAILITMIALLATTPVLTLGNAMKKIYLPDKLVNLFLFTYRYIYVIFHEYRRLLNAMKIRAFQPGTNIHTYRSYAYLVGMLLVKSYDRADRIHRAMLCRGFNGTYYTLSQFSIKTGDVLYLLFMLTAISGLIVLQWIV
jgi:cobalt/nickel transport system permease protein